MGKKEEQKKDRIRKTMCNIKKKLMKKKFTRRRRRRRKEQLKGGSAPLMASALGGPPVTPSSRPVISTGMLQNQLSKIQQDAITKRLKTVLEAFITQQITNKLNANKIATGIKAMVDKDETLSKLKLEKIEEMTVNMSNIVKEFQNNKEKQLNEFNKNSQSHILKFIKNLQNKTTKANNIIEKTIGNAMKSINEQLSKISQDNQKEFDTIHMVVTNKESTDIPKTPPPSPGRVRSVSSPATLEASTASTSFTPLPDRVKRSLTVDERY